MKTDQLNNLFTVGIPIAFCASVIRHASYYQIFGINIFEYCSVTDLLLSIIPDIILIVVCIFPFSTLGAAYLVNKINDRFPLATINIISTPSTTTANIIGTNRVNREERRKMLFYLWLIMNVLILSAFWIVLLLDCNMYDVSFAFANVLLLASMDLLFITESYVAFFLKFNYIQLRLYMVASCILLAMAYIGLCKGFAVKYSENYQPVYKVTFDDKKIITGPTIRMIGKNDQYFFFYNINNGQRYIYNVDELKSIIITAKD